MPAAVLGLVLAGGGLFPVGIWHKVGFRTALLNAAFLTTALIVLRGQVQGG